MLRQLYPLLTSSITHWVGGWVGSRASLDAVEKEVVRPRRELNPESSVVQSVAKSLHRLS
jgi:hypothetical protein